MSNWKIALSDLDFGSEESAAVQRVLASRWLSMGPEVRAFEEEFAAFLGVKHAFACTNGTAALHLAYLALEIGDGAEIIQPAINFVAAANMTVAVRATPVFTDIIGLEEPTIDPAEVERLITPRTKAVVVMHYGGYPCRMAELSALCARHKLALIEDACHAVGARYLDPQQRPPHGKMAGTLGDVACFSFFSNKNLAMGEGGMIVTDRDDLAERLRPLRSHGMTTLTWDRHRGHASSYDVLRHGYNYRLDELHAAIGRAQLAKLAANNRRRGERIATYRHELAGLTGWLVPFADYRGDSAYHLMSLVTPATEARSQLTASLNNAGIQTSMHYPCITRFQAFARWSQQPVARSLEYAARAVTLPMHPGLSDPQVQEICGHVRHAQ